MNRPEALTKKTNTIDAFLHDEMARRAFCSDYVEQLLGDQSFAGSAGKYRRWRGPCWFGLLADLPNRSS